MKSLLTLIVGIVVGAISVCAYVHFQNSSVEVWESNKTFITQSGINLPAGTKFVVAEYMPEGFVALNLTVNVEGQELSSFQKTVVSNSKKLRMPVWVQISN
ncbi:hypothetical protein N473_26575 [Pseudoalteromonas luteoviolacea CPMOR-1]|uniref:Uncharacterized protein n=1 Tax=Pseudoalteromonas luteoviolacea CPMOR-1 TaxID=1365248 RepID=A0A167HD51_9GAMM|nr:hypothetical protein [Pseudoalteromonas luteoviolacea]KZN57993.1 hypothetical protein N473_26575 [Pseudoalteromonas luteoviolacea CPMOR-1]